MKEEPVFWLGGRPGTPKAAAAPPEAGRLEPAIRDACRAHGLEPEEFVAALGGYGSWLVHFSRAGCRERIVWNGRERKLVLQRAVRSGGWQDRQECVVQAADEADLAHAIGELLGHGDPARPG